ncbi:MAG: DUF2089 domain-containing protein [Chloroflexia bacterium]
MNPMPGLCPVCRNTLAVTRMQCGQCGTGIDGLFGIGRLQALTPEQVQFVEIFIKNRGKIKDVERELDISYPTVVARLNEVVSAMGYEVNESDLSEVDQYEYYQAQVIKPQPLPDMPMPPVPPRSPMPPRQPAPYMVAPRVTPKKGGQKLNPEKKQEVLDDLASGKISAAEAMEKLNG